MGARQTTGHLRLPTDTMLRSTAAQSQLWWDLTSHHLHSWERDIPAASASASGDHCPIQEPPRKGTRQFPLARGQLGPCFPLQELPATAAPSTKADLNPRWAELLSPPKKQLLLEILGSSHTEMGERGGRGRISMGSTAWDSGKARKATQRDTNGQ